MNPSIGGSPAKDINIATPAIKDAFSDIIPLTDNSLYLESK